MSAIIVLGGHRCGTSSVAGAIAQLGIPAALPGDDIGASPSNPRGHFEDSTLVRLHQRMLGPGGWRDPQPPIATATQLLPRYDGHLQSRAAAAERWLIKDPRLCFLLPVLTNRLQSLNFDLSVIGVTRRLPAVAESLRRRHRMSLAAAQRIAWLYEGARRTQVAWIATLPSLPLLQLDYDEILAERNAAVSRLAQFLGVEPTTAAVEFLDPGLRHHLQLLPVARSREVHTG
jgi:hypothetical protein